MGLTDAIVDLALVEVLDRYERAQLGELNTTAEALRAACEARGWRRDSGVGYLPWVRARLGRLAP